MTSTFSGGSALVGTTTSWKVTQRGAGANMSVDIAAGSGFIPSSSFYYAPWSDATENAAVTTSDPSNPRRDIVVAYFDLAVPSTAANNSPNALKFMVVAGTAAASPSDPNSSVIQAAVSAGNPWIYLARIRIGTPGSYVAPSTITDSMIDDLRQPVSFKGRLWGGSSNTNGHVVPNVADDTLALLGAAQTFTGNNTFGGPLNIGGFDITGASQSWTPSLTNMTGGAVTYARYSQVGKLVFYRLKYTLAGAGISGSVSFSLPVTAHADYTVDNQIGAASYVDNGSQLYTGYAGASSTTTATFKLFTVSGSNVIGTTNLSASVPFTWGAADYIIVSGWYVAP